VQGIQVGDDLVDGMIPAASMALASSSATIRVSKNQSGRSVVYAVAAAPAKSSWPTSLLRWLISPRPSLADCGGLLQVVIRATVLCRVGSQLFKRRHIVYQDLLNWG